MEGTKDESYSMEPMRPHEIDITMKQKRGDDSITLDICYRQIIIIIMVSKRKK
jgi:hypothetical protein